MVTKTLGKQSLRRMLSGPARALSIGALVSMLSLAVTLPAMGPAVAASGIPLTLSQGVAFEYLGHSCGGIQEQSYATGFDAETGYPAGAVYAQTKCGGSGRGGGYHTTTYSAWVTVVWDFTGAIVSSSHATSGVTVDPNFSATDASGNEIYNSNGQAYLVLGPGFIPTPRVTGISVTSGPASGGTAVTLTGTGFTYATSVSFGTQTASFTVTNDQSLQAITPATAAGTVSVVVASAGGPDAQGNAFQFTFIALPHLDSVTPNHGPVTGGTLVTLTGSGLSGATSVTFDGIWAPFTVNSDSSISVTTPAGENPDNIGIAVTTAGGVAKAKFTYDPLPAPIVTRVTPAHGPKGGGTKVTISGKNFTDVTRVVFGRTVAQFTLLSTAKILAVSPKGSGTVDIRVIGTYGHSGRVQADHFHFSK